MPKYKKMKVVSSTEENESANGVKSLVDSLALAGVAEKLQAALEAERDEIVGREYY